ncbi:MAG: hypothetical protein ACYC69_18180 [Thermodesulfovibrionales bacterium]
MAFAAIILSLASGPVWAADFTFTVPVEVSNLPPDSRQGAVSCSLHTSPARLGAAGVGNGYVPFTISSGAYRGEVTVTANANPGIDPVTVTHYSCALSFYATLRGTDHQFSYWLTSRPSTLPVAPGAPFSPRVDGAIR